MTIKVYTSSKTAFKKTLATDWPTIPPPMMIQNEAKREATIKAPIEDKK